MQNVTTVSEASTFNLRKVKRAVLTADEGLYLKGVKGESCEDCSLHLALIVQKASDSERSESALFAQG
ncbi:hypothetical protein [Pseudoalteromonas luteoviolacea]|uniref:hypothetical protein n=1 Tax=Pseudoalteromonas luteoviolacea TaxID=43657 RepID=UPI001B3962D7|nr:hypothetical protein [Pseudoalteromonas luteoviolacea]MBQ4839339.1 hypothetical protein [Pseudoalteromonas luteoviolacea]